MRPASAPSSHSVTRPRRSSPLRNRVPGNAQDAHRAALGADRRVAPAAVEDRELPHHRTRAERLDRCGPEARRRPPRRRRRPRTTRSTDDPPAEDHEQRVAVGVALVEQHRRRLDGVVDGVERELVEVLGVEAAEDAEPRAGDAWSRWSRGGRAGRRVPPAPAPGRRTASAVSRTSGCSSSRRARQARSRSAA